MLKQKKNKIRTQKQYIKHEILKHKYKKHNTKNTKY